MFYLLYVFLYAVTLLGIDREYSDGAYIYFAVVCGISTSIIYIGLYYIYNTKNSFIHGNTDRDTILGMGFRSLLGTYHEHKLVEGGQLVWFSVNASVFICLLMFIDLSTFGELYYFLLAVSILNSAIDLNELENEAIKKNND